MHEDVIFEEVASIHEDESEVQFNYFDDIYSELPEHLEDAQNLDHDLEPSNKDHDIARELEEEYILLRDDDHEEHHEMIEEENLLSHLCLDRPMFEGCPFSKAMFVAINLLLSLTHSTASLSLIIQCMTIFFPQEDKNLKWVNLKRRIYRRSKQSLFAYSNTPCCHRCGLLLAEDFDLCIGCGMAIRKGYVLRLFPFATQIRTVVEGFCEYFLVSRIESQLQSDTGMDRGDITRSPYFRIYFDKFKKAFPFAKYVAFAGLWSDGFGQTQTISKKQMWPLSCCFYNLTPSKRNKIPNICQLALVPGKIHTCLLSYVFIYRKSEPSFSTYS